MTCAAATSFPSGHCGIGNDFQDWSPSHIHITWEKRMIHATTKKAASMTRARRIAPNEMRMIVNKIDNLALLWG